VQPLVLDPQFVNGVVEALGNSVNPNNEERKQAEETLKTA